MLGMNVFWECCVLLLFSLESGWCPHALLEATTDPQCVYSEVPGRCCHAVSQHNWSHACWVKREADLLCKLCSVCMFVRGCLSLSVMWGAPWTSLPWGQVGECLIGSEVGRAIENGLKGFCICHYFDSTAPNLSHGRTCSDHWLLAPGYINSTPFWDAVRKYLIRWGIAKTSVVSVSSVQLITCPNCWHICSIVCSTCRGMIGLLPFAFAFVEVWDQQCCV